MKGAVDEFWMSGCHVIRVYNTKLLANCANPNQTAHEEQSDRGLHCLFIKASLS